MRTGVPGKVEVEEVGAVRLEVQAFASRVRGEQDSQWILRRTFLEAALDLLAAGPSRQPVDYLDALVGPVCPLDRAFQRLLQESLGTLSVLGKDQDAAVVPFGCLANRLPIRRKIRAQVGADPVDEPVRFGVRPGARLVGNFPHAVQQAEFLLPDLLRRGVAPKSGFGFAVGGLDQAFLLGFFGGLGVSCKVSALLGFGIRAQVFRGVVVGSGSP